MTMDYLQGLHSKHEDWLGQGRPAAEWLAGQQSHLHLLQQQQQQSAWIGGGAAGAGMGLRGGLGSSSSSSGSGSRGGGMGGGGGSVPLLLHSQLAAAGWGLGEGGVCLPGHMSGDAPLGEGMWGGGGAGMDSKAAAAAAAWLSGGSSSGSGGGSWDGVLGSPAMLPRLLQEGVLVVPPELRGSLFILDRATGPKDVEPTMARIHEVPALVLDASGDVFQMEGLIEEHKRKVSE